MARQQNLLSMVQDITSELNLSVPASVIGNLNKDVIQVYALLKRSLRELIRLFQWQALETQFVFYTQYLTTTGDVLQGSNVITNVSFSNAPASLLSNPTYYFCKGSTASTQDVRIVSIDTVAQTVTLNQPATLSLVGQTLLFSQQVYDLPADYDAMVNRTHWDSSKRWEMLGPESPQQFNWLKEGYISTGPRIRWRIQDGKFNTWPYYGTNERLSFEYRSNSGVVDADTVTTKPTFTADTDLIVLDEMLLILKTKLAYFEIKGMDTEFLDREYRQILSITKANDHGASILSFSPRPSEVLIGYQNLPDAGYGS